ncbi:hypothetical protein [Caulobacter segnis]
MADDAGDIVWLIDALREATVVSAPDISADTEIYYDLRISGDDLDALVDAAARRCGPAALVLEPAQYAPGEAGDWFDGLFKARAKRRYPSFTVGKLLAAMAQARANGAPI